MTEKTEFAEIEVIVTAEITYIYRGEELAHLAKSDLLPGSPEELANFKRDVANDLTAEIIEHMNADHVSVTNVQYFEKEPDSAAESVAELAA